ncbi:TetR/AcrR family transcriptional regulator [Brevibacillus sp. M2.1A]|uniref:TetR/AcrR family transcriptional regulator n=1 Tax=Brevibacillus TaxID=55080 RepID=UPI00156ACB77|nr:MULTISPECIES: TetR/AcrR family transcriptional regulator [Brevibacillus]MBY0085700.1 TetR/AcrR family transcriptional regulator [Brevibacillus brevis]MCC8435005.1 TetR/AcrR family transcriptional regulator [Brevibacillus sp. M2.1A]MCE0449917.1 TetR/AcrR family transcriptional regulator [Brevibacillus sp. AF8]UKK97396.1 TetR/AcrR family transcriptional regulator [Brevibacillus brevis]
MRKGEKTKLHIIQKSAELFNQNGYTGTSMQDIMDATGLTKGALYRGFASKDEIAIEAFKYAGEVLQEHFAAALEKQDTATAKIVAMATVYSDAVNNPPLQGGCPLLNTAVESDHSFPVLRDYAVTAYQEVVSFMQGLLEEGIAQGEFRSDMDAEAVASFIFSSIEGAIMASRLTRDNKHVHFAIKHIEQLLQTYKP